MGRFPVIAEISRSHTFLKEINHASARSQYFNGNFYCKNCLRVFSAMTGNKAKGGIVESRRNIKNDNKRGEQGIF